MPHPQLCSVAGEVVSIGAWTHTPTVGQKMGKRPPSNRKYWDWIRLQWAPVLRAVRELVIASRKALREKRQSLLKEPSVR